MTSKAEKHRNSRAGSLQRIVASSHNARQNAAYRRLAAAILGVDVASLTRDLRELRFDRQHAQNAA